MNGKPHILVVGSVNMDLVVRTPRIPQPGETIIGTDFLLIPGGKGANQAVAAGKLQ
ncbi:MAG: PfkB family carbohydrate kinase, partial [Planctomycetota bacterium]|nr:PfkB family carbohydrate kinase [Planctomycetota bacterium]